MSGMPNRFYRHSIEEAATVFANEVRGLYIPGSDFTYHCEGAYSVVFVSRSGRPTARKIFRRAAPGGREHSQLTFAAEVAAYELAMGSPDARLIVPQLFGQQHVLGVRDRDQTDVSQEFYLDLAFDMEFIDMRFEKLSQFGERERFRVSSILAQVGIMYAADASASGTTDCISKVIDFSTHEIELWHS